MASEEKGFLGSLMDLSFTSFVTTKLIKVMYILDMVLIGLIALLIIGAGFATSPILGFVFIITVAPLFVLFALIYTRVILELIIVLFRIAENTAEMASQGRNNAPPPTI